MEVSEKYNKWMIYLKEIQISECAKNLNNTQEHILSLHLSSKEIEEVKWVKRFKNSISYNNKIIFNQSN